MVGTATPEHDSSGPFPQKHSFTVFIVEVISTMVVFIFILIVLASFPLERGKQKFE